MIVIMQNLETGETKEHEGSSGKVPFGWKVVSIKPDPITRKKLEKTSEQTAALAVWATKLGFPVASFLDTARWLLNKDCPFCQLGTQVLRRLEELGEEKSRYFLSEILKAKESGDTVRLEELKCQLE